jgi:uncharacterized protein (TIGR02453 family)
MNETIPREVFSYFERLSQNNTREWFAENKDEFKEIENEVKQVFQMTLENMRVHDDIEKMKMFRIYRDVRFSKDKTPYKTRFAAGYTRATARLRGGYYVNIGPGDNFIAAGFWDPNKEDLFRIRKEIELDATEMRKIIAEKNYKKHWGELVGDTLKTVPRGFDKEHPAIDLLRHKQFIVVKKFTKEEVLARDFGTVVNEHFKAIRPFFNYMSEVLTTDLNGVSLID